MQALKVLKGILSLFKNNSLVKEASKNVDLWNDTQLQYHYILIVKINNYWKLKKNLILLSLVLFTNCLQILYFFFFLLETGLHFLTNWQKRNKMSSENVFIFQEILPLYFIEECSYIYWKFTLSCYLLPNWYIVLKIKINLIFLYSRETVLISMTNLIKLDF